MWMLNWLFCNCALFWVNSWWHIISWTITWWSEITFGCVFSYLCDCFYTLSFAWKVLNSGTSYHIFDIYLVLVGLNVEVIIQNHYPTIVFQFTRIFRTSSCLSIVSSSSYSIRNLNTHLANRCGHLFLIVLIQHFRILRTVLILKYSRLLTIIVFSMTFFFWQ